MDETVDSLLCKALTALGDTRNPEGLTLRMKGGAALPRDDDALISATPLQGGGETELVASLLVTNNNDASVATTFAPDATVATIKLSACERLGLNPSEMELRLNGDVLDPAAPVASIDLERAEHQLDLTRIPLSYRLEITSCIRYYKTRYFTDLTEAEARYYIAFSKAMYRIRGDEPDTADYTKIEEVAIAHAQPHGREDLIRLGNRLIGSWPSHGWAAFSHFSLFRVFGEVRTLRFQTFVSQAHLRELGYRMDDKRLKVTEEGEEVKEECLPQSDYRLEVESCNAWDEAVKTANVSGLTLEKMTRLSTLLQCVVEMGDDEDQDSREDKLKELSKNMGKPLRRHGTDELIKLFGYCQGPDGDDVWRGITGIVATHCPEHLIDVSNYCAMEAAAWL